MATLGAGFPAGVDGIITPRLWAYVGGPDKETNGAIAGAGVAALKDGAVLGVTVPENALVPSK